MSLTPTDLAAVEAASKRERAHRAYAAKLAPNAAPDCACDTCINDLRTIAKHTPEILSLLRGWMNQPRRGCTDFGDGD